MASEHENMNLAPDARAFLYENVSLEMLSQNAKSESLHWGPTPLNPYYSRGISDTQEGIKRTLEQRTMNVPAHLEAIPQDMRTFVTHSFNARFVHRVTENFENFVNRLKLDTDGLDEPQLQLIERAITGDASPAELIYIRSLLGIKSIELGCLTHPYGTNIEQLETMRASVSDAVAMLGGELLDKQPEYEVAHTDSFYQRRMPNHMNDAFAMTRKRDIAVLPDESIVRERSSFIIRIDPASGFDQKIAANMRKVPVHHNPYWAKHIAIAGRLNEIVPGLLESNDFARAIPLSTTVFNFDRKTTKHKMVKSLAEQAMDQFQSNIAFLRKKEKN